MKLFINTSDRDKIVVGLDGEMYETDARQEKSQRLLPFINEILAKHGKNICDLKEIEVNTGPGSFTGIRVGVSVANALGWELKIPVNGKMEGETEIKYS